jgi:hypothetical protein
MFFRNFPKTVYDYMQNGIQTKVVDLFRFVKPIEEFKDELDLYSFYQIQEGDRPDVVSQLLYGTPEYYWTFFIINETLRSSISAWPLSSYEFEKYMQEEYSGTVVTCRPHYVYDGDGLLVSIENSLADRFEIGEPVVGFLSGATGVIHSKDPNKQQLVITDVEGVFQENEIVRGNYTEDSVTTYQVMDWQLAPHHFEDADGREVDNSLFISGATLWTQSTIVTYREYEEKMNDERSKIRIVRPERIFEFAQAYQELINR